MKHKVPEVGDVIVYTNGQQLKVIGTMDTEGNRQFILTGVDNSEAYVNVFDIHNINAYVFDEHILIQEVIPARKIQTIRVL